MSRGFTKRHDMDLSLQFLFVDRGGRYVYSTVRGDRTLGIMRVDFESGLVQADLKPHPREGAEFELELPTTDIDPAQLELALEETANDDA